MSLSLTFAFFFPSSKDEFILEDFMILVAFESKGENVVDKLKGFYEHFTKDDDSGMRGFSERLESKSPFTRLSEAAKLLKSTEDAFKDAASLGTAGRMLYLGNNRRDVSAKEFYKTGWWSYFGFDSNTHSGHGVDSNAGWGDIMWTSKDNMDLRVNTFEEASNSENGIPYWNRRLSEIKLSHIIDPEKIKIKAYIKIQGNMYLTKICC